MKLPVRLLATALPAAMIIACPLVASAHPAPHPASGKAHKSSTKPDAPAHKNSGKGAHGGGHVTRDPLAGVRRGAANAISAQARAVGRLEASAADLTGVSTANLQTALTADAAAIADDASAVAAATDRAGIRQAVSAAGVTRQVARIRFNGVRAADDATSQAETLATDVTDLQAQLADLAAQGTDTSTGDAALADASAQLDVVTADAADLVAAALGLSPTADRAAVHGAVETAETDADAISTALDAAAADVAEVQTTFDL